MVVVKRRTWVQRTIRIWDLVVILEKMKRNDAIFYKDLAGISGNLLY